EWVPCCTPHEGGHAPVEERIRAERLPDIPGDEIWPFPDKVQEHLRYDEASMPFAAACREGQRMPRLRLPPGKGPVLGFVVRDTLVDGRVTVFLDMQAIIEDVQVHELHGLEDPLQEIDDLFVSLSRRDVALLVHVLAADSVFESVS